MIQGSNNPFSCTPAVVGLNNQIIELGTISRVDDTFTFSTGFKWMINSQNYENTTTFDYTPDPATTDFKRIDVAVLNQNNEIEFLAGTESDTIALRPTIPVNNLLLTQWNINGSSIEDSVDPLIGDVFVKKSFAQPYIFNGTGSNQEIPLDALGRTEIRLNNSSLVSVKGFNLSLITGNSSAEVPYIGKEYVIRNITGVDITILHNDLSAGLLFLSKDGSNVLIPNGESLTIKYGGGGFYEGLRSWLNATSLVDTNFQVVTSLPTTGIETNKLYKLPDGSFNWHNGTNWNTLGGGGVSQYPKVIVFNNNSDGSILPLTGTTATTIIASFTIPANTIPANCELRLNVKMKCSGTAGQKYYYSNWDNTNVSVKPFSPLTSFSNTTNQNINVLKTMLIRDGDAYTHSVTNQYEDYLWDTANNTFLFDVTVDNTLNIWGRLVNSADTLEFDSLILEVLA